MNKFLPKTMFIWSLFNISGILYSNVNVHDKIYNFGVMNQTWFTLQWRFLLGNVWPRHFESTCESWSIGFDILQFLAPPVMPRWILKILFTSVCASSFKQNHEHQTVCLLEIKKWHIEKFHPSWGDYFRFL